jgi:hypothetical protein
MNKMTIFSLIAASLGLASTAFGWSGDDRCCGFLFWVFISFGALVVLAQLIPAVLVVIGFTKGFPIKPKMAEAVKEGKGP